VDVVGFVDEEDVFVLGGLGCEKVIGLGGFRFQQTLADAAVFLGREDVLANGQVIAVAIDEFEREHGIAGGAAVFVTY